MPFIAAAIPCSRIPKYMLRPPSAPGPRSSAPSISVLVEPPRSAEPPSSSGSTGASALSTVPDAARVAVGGVSGGKEGSAPSQPSGNRPAIRRVSSRAASGCRSR